jgi:hypothetical protein
MEWKMVSPWYFGSSHSLYFDMLGLDFKIRRFQIILEPDLSAASLHAINTSELDQVIPHNLYYLSSRSYRICEDNLVSCWTCTDPRCYDRPHQYQCGVYTGLTSARFANLISPSGVATEILLPDVKHDFCLFFCPASGRFVFLNSKNSVVVLDFF